MYYNAKAPLFLRIERLFRTWRLSQRLHPVNVLIKNWSQLYKKNDFNSKSESEIYKINWENPSLLCIEMGVLKKPSLKLFVSLVYEKSQNLFAWLNCRNSEIVWPALFWFISILSWTERCSSSCPDGLINPCPEEWNVCVNSIKPLLNIGIKSVR